MKWRWNTLTQRVLQVVRNTKKSPVSGGETPSPPAEEKETAQNGGKKALCSLYIAFLCVVEVEVWLRVECRQGDSSAVWGQLQGVGEGYGRGGTW